jgi:hypothetical protein
MPVEGFSNVFCKYFFMKDNEKDNKIDLYCTQCDKSYSVKKEELTLMMPLHQKSISLQKGKYRFDGGCFFKELAILKRQKQNLCSSK